MPQGKPNLLFIFPDQWRWEWLGFPGRVPVRTPHLDRLAKWGLSFDQVRCNSPICAPSRACVATARRYPEAGVRNNFEELDPERHNLFKALRDGGYQVLTTGKSDLHTVSENYSPTGWHDHLEKLGFTHGSDQAGKWRGVNLLKNGIPEAYGAFLQERGLAVGRESVAGVFQIGSDRRHGVRLPQRRFEGREVRLLQRDRLQRGRLLGGFFLLLLLPLLAHGYSIAGADEQCRQHGDE